MMQMKVFCQCCHITDDQGDLDADCKQVVYCLNQQIKSEKSLDFAFRFVWLSHSPSNLNPNSKFLSIFVICVLKSHTMMGPTRIRYGIKRFHTRHQDVTSQEWEYVLLISEANRFSDLCFLIWACCAHLCVKQVLSYRQLQYLLFSLTRTCILSFLYKIKAILGKQHSYHPHDE